MAERFGLRAMETFGRTAAHVAEGLYPNANHADFLAQQWAEDARRYGFDAEDKRKRAAYLRAAQEFLAYQRDSRRNIARDYGVVAGHVPSFAGSFAGGKIPRDDYGASVLSVVQKHLDNDNARGRR
jgi:hypothetical protein